MFEIAGLPAHILLIHGVVILAPAAGILAILFAVAPRLRRFLAWPLGVLAVILVPLSLLTAEAGEQLQHSRPATAAIAEHAEQGDLFKIAAIIFFVIVAAQLATAFPRSLTRFRLLQGLRGLLTARWVQAVAIGLGITGGAFMVYQSIITGHSGAASVWGS